MDTITAILENAVARLADARAMLKSGCPSPAFVATHTAPETAMLALCDAASDLRVQIALENDDDYEYSASNTSYGYYNKERRAIHLLANGSVTPQVIYTATHELGHHADPGLPSLTIFDKFFVSEPLREAEITAECVAAMMTRRLGLVDTTGWCPLYIASYMLGGTVLDLGDCARRAETAIARITDALEGRLAA